MWGELWSTLATGRVGRYLYASYAFAFILFFLIRELPIEIAAILTALLPVISTLVLGNARNEPRREPVSIIFDMEPIPKAKVFVMLVLVSVTWGFSQSVLGMVTTVPDALGQSFLFAGVGIAALALNIFISQPRVEAFSLYRPIIPAMVIGLILLVALPTNLAFVGSGLTVIAIYSLDMLIMLVSTDVAFRSRLPVALSFGLPILAARTGTFIGSLAFGTLFGSSLWFDGLEGTILLICAVIVVFVGTMIFNQSDLQGFYKAKPSFLYDNDSVAHKCENIGLACGLTARELEVLCLLANGRSVPYICDELSIAQGTAKHHVSNIYRKVGVYDRQSLHDIIEQGSVGRGAL
jgi:DNA-binding CsgD family transcriptional regulator